MSGVFHSFQLSASSFLESARSFADNALGALFNLANIPKPQPKTTAIPGIIASSHQRFIEALQKDFLPQWMNTPEALYKFQRKFEAQDPSTSKGELNTPAEFFFARLVDFIESTGRPFYRVREAIAYLTAQYPQGFGNLFSEELLALVDQYEQALAKDPEKLITQFKVLFQDAVEGRIKESFDNLITSFNLEDPSYSNSVETLDQRLRDHFSKKFPQLDFLLSDAFEDLTKRYFDLLPPDYADYVLRFHQELLKYINRLSKDVESSIFYEDRISDVYQDARNRIAGLQKKLEASKPKEQKQSAPSERTRISSQALRPVTQAMQKVTRHFSRHPSHLFVIGLSFLGTGASAERSKETIRNLQSVPFATPVNISVGSALSYYVGSYYNCGTYLNSTTILACPSSSSSMTDISTLTPPYPFAKWLSNIGMTLIGTPKITDRFWQGVQRNLQRYTCPSNFNAVYSLCSTMEQLAVRFTFWIQDTPPYPIALANETQPDHSLEPGIQPIFGDGSSFSGNFLINGPGDLENDTVLFQASLANGGRLPVWMTPVPSSGDITVVPPPGNAGKWNVRMRLYNPDWDGKTILDYSFNTVTWSSSRWISSYIRIPAQPIQLNIPINDQVYVATSGQKLVISAATSAIVTVPSATPVNITLQAAGNGSLPVNMAYKASRQAVEFSPNPQQVSFGTYDCELLVCDTPSFACASNTACEPVAASCVAVPFSAEYRNSAPQLPQLSPASTTIGTAITVTSIAVRSTDADLDALTFSVRIKPDTGHAMPEGILIDSRTGEVSWLPTKGTAPGTYQFEILADDGRGAVSSTSWTVTINPRPIQIKSGLQSTVASTPMQRAGSATYPFPFRAPDLTDAQLPAFATQVDVQIPEALAPFVSVQLNTSTLSYNVSWTGIPGHGGSSPVIFTYTDPLTGQQTSTQTFLEVTNAGPYKISNPVLVTNLTGTPVAYDLAAHFGHLDPNTALHFSADLPVGLELSDEGRITGVPATPGHYKVAVSVTDDYGRTLSSASLDLTVPYAPPTVLSSHRADISVAINPASFTPELTGTFQTPSPDGLAQTYSLISGPPCFTVTSDGSWAVNPQNGQQGNYTALIQVRNGDQVATFSKPISIPRAAIQTLSNPAFSSYIARSFSMDACTLITDPDSPGTCSNFQVSFNPPEALAAYVTNTGTVYNFNPLAGAQVQGHHSLSFRFTDKITGQVFTVPVLLTYQNQAPQTQNGVSQKTVTATDESVFTTPYMEASDLDGDALNRTITGAPPACLPVDAEKQLSCTNVPAGNYPVVFSFSDGHGGTISATLLLQISRVTQIPWYISRAQDALPGIAGSFFLFFLPVFLKYRRDRRKTAGLDALYLKLPRVIADITKRQVTYLHHQALAHESHPLGVIPLIKSTAERSQRRMPTLAAVATSAMTTPPMQSAGSTSPRASSPSGLRRRVAAPISAGPSGGAPNSPPSMTTQATPVTPTTQNSPAATPIQPMSLSLGYAKQASHLSKTLKDKIEEITDDPEAITEFQTEFNLYLKALDQYHEHQGPDIVRNCNLMKLTEAIAQRLDDLIDRTKPHITDKITMMVHWLKLLYVRFVFYSSGLTTSPSIKLIDKRNLLQGLTELIKAVRSKLDRPQLLALYKELEFLRALITSVPDEDRASFWKSLPFPCIRRPDRGTATLPDDALIPKTWFLQVLAIQELSQIARIDLAALTQLNTWVESANGEGITGWIPFKKHYPRIQITVGELLSLQPLSHSKDRGEVNYWAADAYLSILEYWCLGSTRVQISDLDYLKTLTSAISKMFSRSFADQVSEELIKNIAFQKLQENLLTLFKKLPAEMAASCLLNFSNEFKHPIIQELLTRYLKETPTSLEEFYQELRRQYKDTEKAKGIDAWLRTTPDDTPGVIKLRGDILTWRRVQSGRALTWLGISRSSSNEVGVTSAMVTNPLRSPGAQAVIGAKAMARPDPIGGSVPSSSEVVARLWRSPGRKNQALSSRTLPGQTPGKVRDDKQEVRMEA